MSSTWSANSRSLTKIPSSIASGLSFPLSPSPSDLFLSNKNFATEEPILEPEVHLRCSHEPKSRCHHHRNDSDLVMFGTPIIRVLYCSLTKSFLDLFAQLINCGRICFTKAVNCRVQVFSIVLRSNPFMLL